MKLVAVGLPLHRIALFILLLVSVEPFAQTVMVNDGIINSYGQVVAIDYCTNSIDLAGNQESQFSIGDRVLIIQMKGAELSASDDSLHGSPTNYQGAGNYEINVVKTINFAGINGIEFEFEMSKLFDANGRVQVVSIPQYPNNVQFNNTLSCLPWDGNIGGVVIFEAQGEVILNANINVTGNGFRGAATYAIPNACYNNITGQEFGGYDCPFGDDCGGRKGEGIGQRDELDQIGRGRNGNGGGGGHNDNAGGGGGSNAGFGGKGGDNDNIVTGFCQGTGGSGGANLVYSNTESRVFLGGGGGAGYNGNGQATNGANGGGMVFIRANSITANGFSIFANGISAGQAGGDGSGGGGAGGTIILDVPTVNDALIIEATGGQGGDIFDNSNCPGVGGGGGGGMIWSQSGTFPANVTAEVDGGIEGAHQAALCTGVTMGVEPGGNGSTETGFTANEATEPYVAFSLNAQMNDTLCLGESTMISANAAGSLDFDFTWDYNGETFTDLNLEVAPEQNGINTYTAQIMATIFGQTCLVEEAVEILVPNPTITLTFSPDTPVLEGEVVFLNALVQPSNPNYIFSWTPADLVQPNDQRNALAEPFQTTEFCLTVTDEIGCSKTECDFAQVKLPYVGAPDAFTPNADGDNDFYQVIPEFVLEMKRFTVYNRWGTILYQSDSSFEWDGKVDGVLQPSGQYVWSAMFEQRNTGETSQQVGSFTLIR